MILFDYRREKSAKVWISYLQFLWNSSSNIQYDRFPISRPSLRDRLIKQITNWNEHHQDSTNAHAQTHELVSEAELKHLVELSIGESGNTQLNVMNETLRKRTSPSRVKCTLISKQQWNKCWSSSFSWSDTVIIQSCIYQIPKH